MNVGGAQVLAADEEQRHTVGQSVDPMNIDLDIAAALSAVIWPIIVLVIFLAYRSKLPALVGGLASRVSKLEFAGVSLELAVAKPFVPEWSGSSTALDLRHKATAIQVNDSTARIFFSQLAAEDTGDYAEINLGAGGEWLTSRLFIMAIIFARMKGIECFVFVETAGSVRKRFVGWADPAKIRCALAKRYPWLEQAYAETYATVVGAVGALGWVAEDTCRALRGERLTPITQPRPGGARGLPIP